MFHSVNPLRLTKSLQKKWVRPTKVGKSSQKIQGALSSRMIFLGLGSNMGDKAANLARAGSLLTDKGVRVLRYSGLYATAPWGITEQAPFLNAVCEVAWQDDALALLDAALEVEEEMGRVRTQKWGPRLIDIDILEFDRQVWDKDRLKLPHPYYPTRDFVLAPLAELAPDWIPTTHHQRVADLLAGLSGPRPERMSDFPIPSTFDR